MVGNTLLDLILNNVILFVRLEVILFIMLKMVKDIILFLYTLITRISRPDFLYLKIK